jgi:DNA repair protein RadA/Sms
MSKSTTLFSCTACDAQYSKWSGRCLECGKWGTLTEINAPTVAKAEQKAVYPAGKPIALQDVTSSSAGRLSTGVRELDTVLGGGIVPGSLILLGGEPGIGKSTLSLQLATTLPKTLYVSGEESVEQIKLRAERLKVTAPELKLLAETNVGVIEATIDELKPALVIIDSIQTITFDEVDGTAGSVTQVRAVTATLMAYAKRTGTPIILIGQVTKDGAVAGPKTLEHLVDTVLYLEGDRFHNFRILRAVKNRFGSTDEVGIFSMEESGLVEVTNPSVAFLSRRHDKIPGTAITCLMEGSRPLLIEIQALVTKTTFGFPQRRASGFDLNRLQVLLAVLSKRSGLPLESYDVFVNVIGGIQAEEPAADLAVLLAIASATQNKAIPHTIVAFGEVGLSGEVRPVGSAKKRLEEIKKMGFETAVIPEGTEAKVVGLKVAPLKNVQEIIQKILQS